MLRRDYGKKKQAQDKVRLLQQTQHNTVVHDY